METKKTWWTELKANMTSESPMLGIPQLPGRTKDQQEWTLYSTLLNTLDDTNQKHQRKHLLKISTFLHAPHIDIEDRVYNAELQLATYEPKHADGVSLLHKIS